MTAGRVALLVIALASVARGDDGPVTVTASAEPRTVTVGQRFRYTVEVAVVSGAAEILAAQPAERIGDFDIVDFGVEPAVEREGRRIIRRWYTLVGWSPGNHLLVSPPVQYRVTSGEGMTDAPAQEMGIEVSSLLAQEPQANDLHDIRDIEPVPVDWRPYGILGGAVAFLVLVVLVAWQLWRRRNAPAVVARPEPPHLVATRALTTLRARGLTRDGRFKEYYSGVSDIVRTYLEQRYAVRAPEMTTEEFFAASARDGRLAPAHRRLLGEFLTESDLVKFARLLPAITDADRAYDAALRFVTETAPSLAPEETPRAVG